MDAPITDVAVETVGTIDCTVSGNTVTVDHETACKVGYLVDGKYVKINGIMNTDGSFSYVVPEDAASVMVVVSGDTNGDGVFTNADCTRAKAAFNSKVDLTPAQLFGCDVNDDSIITNADCTRLKAVFNSKTDFVW